MKKTSEDDSPNKAVVDSKTASKSNNFFRNRTGLAVVILFAVIGAGFFWAKAATTTYSIWSNSAVPKTITDTDTQSVELGTVFSTKYAGQVTGVKFYKGAQNIGTHTGSLWDLKGHKLATVTFKNETASGWQTATFPQPISIAANSPYVISYHAPNGHYSADGGYFANQYASGPLKALQDTNAHPNGVYSYSSSTSYPNKTFQSTNYWVDVVFSTNLINPTPKPAPPTGVQAIQNSNAVFVSWNVAISANPLKSYQVIRNGSVIATIDTTKQSYNDTNVTAGKTYTYQIKSVDNTSAVSDASLSASVTYNVTPPPTCPVGETGTPPNCVATTPPPPVGTIGKSINCPLVDSAAAIECWDSNSGIRGADGGKTVAQIEAATNAGTDSVVKYKLTGPGILKINSDGSASWTGSGTLPAAATTRTVNGTVQHGLFNTWVHNACVVNLYNGGQYNNDLITLDTTFQVNGNCASDGSCAASALALGCSNNSSQNHLSFATVSYVTADGGNQQVDSVGIGSGGYSCSHCTSTGFIHNWWAGSQVNISESYGGNISSYYNAAAGPTGQLHRETIDADSANNVTVNHNYLRIDPNCPNNCGQPNAAMMNGGSWAPPSHVTVTNNFLEGGAGADMSEGCGSTDIVVENNAFSSSNGYNSTDYMYGFNTSDPGNVFTGNYVPEKANAPAPNPGNGGC